MKRSWADRENLNQNELAKLEKDGLQILNEMVQYYLNRKKSGERFFHFVERYGTDGLQKILNQYTL
jgi:sulfite reductase beta subunit-like hemoprotein